jgi:NAD(P)-dependent dehydrogenase (short-subunit alcohol dehydrogenase family)
MFDLSGRNALVTGSSRGIGAAIASALARAGAAVVLHARTRSDDLSAVEASLQAEDARVASVTGDLSRDGEAARIVDSASSALGGLHILVNNAGVVVPAGVDEIDGPTWDTVLSVNLRAAFFAAQAAARHMREAGGGRIVNVSSQAAAVAIPTYLPYGVSKAGLEAMSRYLAVELADDGITVNTVAPAFVGTDLAAEVFAQLPDLYEDQLARVPKRRMCTVEEVAAAVVYLVSDEADFTTGSVLTVDGGYLAL